MNKNKNVLDIIVPIGVNGINVNKNIIITIKECS